VLFKSKDKIKQTNLRHGNRSKLSLSLASVLTSKKLGQNNKGDENGVKDPKKKMKTWTTKLLHLYAISTTTRKNYFKKQN